MMRSHRCLGEGRRAFVQEYFAGEKASNPYNKGTMSFFWWSRGVELARVKVSELMKIGG